MAKLLLTYSAAGALLHTVGGARNEQDTAPALGVGISQDLQKTKGEDRKR